MTASLFAFLLFLYLSGAFLMSMLVGCYLQENPSDRTPWWYFLMVVAVWPLWPSALCISFAIDRIRGRP